MRKIAYILLSLLVLLTGCLGVGTAEAGSLGSDENTPLYVRGSGNITQISLAQTLLAYGEAIDIGGNGWIEGWTTNDILKSGFDGGWEFWVLNEGGSNSRIVEFRSADSTFGQVDWHSKAYHIDLEAIGATINGSEFYQARILSFNGTLPGHAVDNLIINSFNGSVPAHTMSGDINTGGYDYNLGSDKIWYTTTGNAEGIFVESDNDGTSGGSFRIWANSDSPAIGDTIGRFQFNGEDSGGATHVYGLFDVAIADPTADTEDGEMNWYLARNGTNSVKVMTLDSAGNLDIDGGYGTFDKYDDAILLRDSIGSGDMEKLEEAGIAEKQYLSDNTSYTWTLSLQQMLRLLSGGVYQNRDKIDELVLRIEFLENQK